MDGGRIAMAVAPYGNLQQKGRKLVPKIDIDKDWEPLPAKIGPALLVSDLFFPGMSYM